MSGGKLAYHIYRPTAVDPLVILDGKVTTATISPVHLIWTHALLGSGRNFISLASTLAGMDSASRILAEAKTNKAEYLTDPIPDTGPAIPRATHARAYTSVTFDWRNHGDSYHSPEMHLDGLAEDLSTFLRDYAARDRFDGLSNAEDMGKAIDKAPPPEPVPLVLIGHSMGAMAIMHWMWYQHINIWSNHYLLGAKSPTKPGNNAFDNPYYRILGSVVIDMAPTQRPMSFNETIRMVEFLPELPLDQVHSAQEAEEWLLKHGPPEVFNAKRIWHIRFHLSNIDFTDPAKPYWRIGLDEILSGLQCILWEEGGIDCVQQAHNSLRIINKRRISEKKHIWERPSKFTEFSNFFVFGEKSPYYTPTTAPSVTMHFHKPHMVIMKGSDHFLFMKQKAPFTELLRNFLCYVENKNGILAPPPPTYPVKT